MKKNCILFISTPVGPLGSGEAGGVESMIKNLSLELAKKNYKITILAPAGSKLVGQNQKIIQIPGDLALSVFGKGKRIKPPYNSDGVLEKMWEWALKNEKDYNKIVSFSFDAFSFDVAKRFKKPIFHFIGVASENKYTDQALRKEFEINSKNFAFMSKVQFQTFGVPRLKSALLSGGVSLKDFKFSNQPKKRLVWAARISPEKNLKFALKIAKSINMPLDICGKIQDKKYFENVLKDFPSKIYKYHGFLSSKKLSTVLGGAQVALFTRNYVEAFALSAVEALASGTPIATFPHTGPAEIASLTKAGKISSSRSVKDFVTAVEEAKKINRKLCRESAICFDWQYFAEAFIKWLY